MNTLAKLNKGLSEIPTLTAWYIGDISQALGKQDLYTKQTPERLKKLRESAIIESAVSSNRMEGVHVEQKRIAKVLFGKSKLHDRNEEEVRGYQQALNWIHNDHKNIKINNSTVKKIHKIIRGEIWDAGKYKVKDSDIIEIQENGNSFVRFKTVTAKQTSASMNELISLWKEKKNHPYINPLIWLASFNLDFLCIHPFRDGNGRVSRLLLLLQLYHLGFEVGKYISLERVIEENKERYYETLYESSQNWHKGKHEQWIYINFVLYILKEAYKEFEERVKISSSPKGSKSEHIRKTIGTISKSKKPFRIRELQEKCPGVSIDLIRRTLKKMKDENLIECLGKGQNATWKMK